MRPSKNNDAGGASLLKVPLIPPSFEIARVPSLSRLSARANDPLGAYTAPMRRSEYPRTTVQYTVPDSRHVTLVLYDVLGRRVRSIVNGQQQGRHSRRMDVSDLPSGTYFLRLRTDGFQKTRRLTIVR